MPQGRLARGPVVAFRDKQKIRVVHQVIRIVDIGSAKRKDGESIPGCEICLRSERVPLAGGLSDFRAELQRAGGQVAPEFVVGHEFGTVTGIRKDGSVGGPSCLDNWSAGCEWALPGAAEVLVFPLLRRVKYILQRSLQERGVPFRRNCFLVHSSLPSFSLQNRNKTANNSRYCNAAMLVRASVFRLESRNGATI